MGASRASEAAGVEPVVATATLNQISDEQLEGLIGQCAGWISSPEVREQVERLGVNVNRSTMTAADAGLLRALCLATGTPFSAEARGYYPGFKSADAKLKAEQSLYEFGQQAWHIVEPDQPFIKARHIELVCRHLEALANGEASRDNLLINIPPGHAKSIFTNVFWPAWVWTRNPSRRFLHASYEQKLSTRDSVSCRSIIESDWYKSRWPHVSLIGDQNQKMSFQNSTKGWRIATSVGGSATGLHPHFIIADDPMDVRRANSELERQKAVNWWTGTISTRGVLVGVKKVVVMQRLHVDDVSGWILQNQRDKYDHICLPARYEPGRMEPTSLGLIDWRMTEGELLWPQGFGEEQLRAIELPLGSIEAAGQLQQRPMIKGGSLFRREWFDILEIANLVGGFAGRDAHYLTPRGLFS